MRDGIVAGCTLQCADVFDNSSDGRSPSGGDNLQPAVSKAPPVAGRRAQNELFMLTQSHFDGYGIHLYISLNALLIELTVKAPM